jgi:hypothetical protein
MAPRKKTGGAKPNTLLTPSASLSGQPGFPSRPVSAMVYSLGDSWFTYPTIFDQGAPINLMRALDSESQPHGKKYFMIERGEAGATSDQLTTGDYFDQLTRALTDNYDFLLLSMGGNDFIGTQQVDGVLHTSFGQFLLDVNKPTTAKEVLDQPAISARLDQTMANYQKVFRLCERESVNKNIQIVTHAYDFPIPSNRGANVLGRWHVVGPWMYGDLVNKNVPKGLWYDVMKALLGQFYARLSNLANDLNTHTQTGVQLLIAATQGSLPSADPNYWVNEIHPRNIGYQLLVKKLEAVIDPLRDALPPAPWRVWPTLD